jgi:hypothetical protein
MPTSSRAAARSAAGAAAAFCCSFGVSGCQKGLPNVLVFPLRGYLPVPQTRSLLGGWRSSRPSGRRPPAESHSEQPFSPAWRVPRCAVGGGTGRAGIEARGGLPGRRQLEEPTWGCPEQNCTRTRGAAPSPLAPDAARAADARAAVDADAAAARRLPPPLPFRNPVFRSPRGQSTSGRPTSRTSPLQVGAGAVPGPGPRF